MLICYNYTNFFKEYIIAKCNQKVEWLRCRNCEDKCEKDLSERGLRVVEECQEKCKQAWRDACDEKVNPLHDCHRWCEREYPNWSKLIERSTCKAKCNGGLTPQEIKCDDKCRNPITARLDKECFSKCNEDFKLHSQEATISDINTSEGNVQKSVSNRKKSNKLI